jgi:hypothetical protein
MMVVAGLVGALCFSAVALGATATYEGKDHDSKCASVHLSVACDLEFHVTKSGAKVTKVKYVVFKALPARCGSKKDFINGYEPSYLNAHVNGKRKFHGSFTANQGDDTATITGRFSKDFKRATGTLRVKGRGSGTAMTGCDTGTDEYGVHK